MKKLTKMAAAVAVAGLSIAAHANLVVDDYTIPQSKLYDTSTGDGGLSSTVSGLGIIGGWRDLYVQKNGNSVDDGDQGVSVLVSSVGTGTLRFSTDTGQRGFAIVRYDGSHFDSFGTANYSGLGALPLSTYGTGFQLSVENSDLGFPFQLGVFTSSTVWSTLDLFATGPFPSNDIVDFTSFLGGNGVTPEGFIRTCGAGGCADFSSVGMLQAIVNTGGLVEDVDLRLDLVKAVPEPGTLALLGIGLLGVAAIRRRKSV